MTDLKVIPWLREFSEAEAVGLARSLIFAEAGRLGLPIANFTMSGRVKAADQGMDGSSNFPDGSNSLLPEGRRVWQVKSGRSAPRAASEFAARHRDLREAISAGCDYVLFWTYDPVVRSSNSIRAAFTRKVQEIRPDARADFLFADTIADLCYSHLAVLSQVPTLPLDGVVSVPVWGASQGFNIEFQPDDARSAYMETLRAHVGSEDSRPSSLHLFGDTGVGKSRLVYEAVLGDGVSQRVLVALDPALLNRSLLTLVANSTQRRLILVVDDCAADDRRSISQLADLAQGRVRLITIGSRYSRDPQPADARYLELLPLATSASRQIALSTGVSETTADQVARYTEGYPKLALVLAMAIARGEQTAGLLERIRGEAVGSVLSSMLSDPDDVRLLGALALFDKLGFDQELAPEVTIACEALGIDESKLRDVSNRELNRFVSSAGRYRLVTPRLLAVWLASEFIRRHADFGDALQKLPESLLERVTKQMTAFAGDTHVSSALRQLFEQPPFTKTVPGDLGVGLARLIHVATIVDPELAMNTIERILGSRSTNDLRVNLSRSRRWFVYGLEILLWFDTTFERAAQALLRLAIAENETWSNNATGVLQGVFRVHLGGTSVPYVRRLRWARSALATYPEARPVLVPGLATGLDIHQMRGATEFDSRTAPEEWRPATVAEEIEARRGAWQLLMDLAREGRESDDVAQALAGGLRSAARRGLIEDILTDLPSVEWSAKSRARLGEVLDDLLEYDSPPPDLGTRFRELRSTLAGSTWIDRLRYVLATPVWDLRDKNAVGDLSPLLTDLAAEIATAGQEVLVNAARESVASEHPQTVSLLFELVAKASPNEEVIRRIESEAPSADSALLGTFLGLASSHDSQWALEVLEQWIDQDYGRLVIPAAHALPASGALVDLAIRAVRESGVESKELGRFLYGAWVRTLRAEHVVEIARVLEQGDGMAEVEHALGMLSHWLDDHPDYDSHEIDQISIDLVQRSMQSENRSSSMLALYRQRVVRSLNYLTARDKVTLLRSILENLDSFLDEHDLALLDELAATDPPSAIDAVFSVIIEEERVFRPNVMWLEQAKILSRLAKAASPEAVVAAIERVPQERWRELVGHVDFSVQEPDALIETLVKRSTDDVVRGRAAFHLIYPEMAWTGPESEYLRARRAVVAAWQGKAKDRAVREWLQETIDEIDSRIAEAERTEAEQDY